MQGAAEAIGDDVGQHDRQLGVLRGESIEIRGRQDQNPNLRRRDDVRGGGLLRDQRHLARHRAPSERADRPIRPAGSAQDDAGLAVDEDEQGVALLPLADDRLVGVVASLARCGEDLIHESRPQRPERLAFEEDLARGRVGGRVGCHPRLSIDTSPRRRRRRREQLEQRVVGRQAASVIATRSAAIAARCLLCGSELMAPC